MTAYGLLKAPMAQFTQLIPLDMSYWRLSRLSSTQPVQLLFVYGSSKSTIQPAGSAFGLLLKVHDGTTHPSSTTSDGLLKVSKVPFPARFASYLLLEVRYGTNHSGSATADGLLQVPERTINPTSTTSNRLLKVPENIIDPTSTTADGLLKVQGVPSTQPVSFLMYY